MCTTYAHIARNIVLLLKKQYNCNYVSTLQNSKKVFQRHKKTINLRLPFFEQSVMPACQIKKVLTVWNEGCQI